MDETPTDNGKQPPQLRFRQVENTHRGGGMGVGAWWLLVVPRHEAAGDAGTVDLIQKRKERNSRLDKLRRTGKQSIVWEVVALVHR